MSSVWSIQTDLTFGLVRRNMCLLSSCCLPVDPVADAVVLAVLGDTRLAIEDAIVSLTVDDRDVARVALVTRLVAGRELVVAVAVVEPDLTVNGALGTAHRRRRRGRDGKQGGCR